jgi:hypothetical protein
MGTTTATGGGFDVAKVQEVGRGHVFVWGDDTYFMNVTSDVKQVINLHGLSSTVNVNGVHFTGLMVQGKAVTSQTDTDASWNINQYVSNITFQ